MAIHSYEEIYNIFRAPQFDKSAEENLIKQYVSIDNAVVKMTDNLPFDEVEKLEQFLRIDITNGSVVYAIERAIIRRRLKDVRNSMEKSAKRAKCSAIFSAVSAVAALITALCVLTNSIIKP